MSKNVVSNFCFQYLEHYSGNYILSVTITEILDKVIKFQTFQFKERQLTIIKNYLFNTFLNIQHT